MTEKCGFRLIAERMVMGGGEGLVCDLNLFHRPLQTDKIFIS